MSGHLKRWPLCDSNATRRHQPFLRARLRLRAGKTANHRRKERHDQKMKSHLFWPATSTGRQLLPGHSCGFGCIKGRIVGVGGRGFFLPYVKPVMHEPFFLEAYAHNSQNFVVGFEVLRWWWGFGSCEKTAVRLLLSQFFYTFLLFFQSVGNFIEWR